MADRQDNLVDRSGPPVGHSLGRRTDWATRRTARPGRRTARPLGPPGGPFVALGGSRGPSGGPLGPLGGPLVRPLGPFGGPRGARGGPLVLGGGPLCPRAGTWAIWRTIRITWILAGPLGALVGPRPFGGPLRRFGGPRGSPRGPEWALSARRSSSQLDVSACAPSRTSVEGAQRRRAGARCVGLSRWRPRVPIAASTACGGHRGVLGREVHVGGASFGPPTNRGSKERAGTGALAMKAQE